MYEPYGPEDEFEQELKDGLRPREAPEGFAERVIALAEGAKTETHASANSAVALPAAIRPGPIRVRSASSQLAYHPTVRWAIAAALLITVALGGYAERQRQVAGERARQQVFLALRITGSTLRAVHDKVADGDE